MSVSYTGELSRFKIKHTEPINSWDASNSHNDDNQTPLISAAQKRQTQKEKK